MRRRAYFQPGESVIVDSQKIPELNGPAIVYRSMWIAARKGAAPGWVYQLLDDRQQGRWLLEKSLRKEYVPAEISFEGLLLSLNYGTQSEGGSHHGEV